MAAAGLTERDGGIVCVGTVHGGETKYFTVIAHFYPCFVIYLDLLCLVLHPYDGRVHADSCYSCRIGR